MHYESTTTTTSATSVLTALDLAKAVELLKGEDMAAMGIDYSYQAFSPGLASLITGGEKTVSVVDKLRELKLSKDDRVLYKHGLIFESGKLTDEGKAAVLQAAFDYVKEDLVASLREIDAEDKKKK